MARTVCLQKHGDDVQLKSDGRYHWSIYKTGPERHVFTTTKKGQVIPTGNVYKRSGNRADRTQAIRDREEALAEYYVQLKHPNAVPLPVEHEDDLTVEQWSKRMVDQIWPGLDKAQTTIDTYGYKLSKHINPYLGDVRLKDLTRLDIQQWSIKIRDKSGVCVADGALTALKSMLKAAHDDHRVPENAAAGVTVIDPKGGDKIVKRHPKMR
jgi:hypothetical protein